MEIHEKIKQAFLGEKTEERLNELFCALHELEQPQKYYLYDDDELSYAYILDVKSTRDKEKALTIENPKHREAYFWPIDKGLISSKKGEQCEGLLCVNLTPEKQEVHAYWVEMKMEVFSNKQETLEERIEKAVGQVLNSRKEIQKKVDIKKETSKEEVYIAIPDRKKNYVTKHSRVLVRLKREARMKVNVGEKLKI
jgi:hypothetical protein